MTDPVIIDGIISSFTALSLIGFHFLIFLLGMPNKVFERNSVKDTESLGGDFKLVTPNMIHSSQKHMDLIKQNPEHTDILIISKINPINEEGKIILTFCLCTFFFSFVVQKTRKSPEYIDIMRVMDSSFKCMKVTPLLSLRQVYYPALFNKSGITCVCLGTQGCRYVVSSDILPISLILLVLT